MASSSPQGFTLALRDKMLAAELTLPAAARRPAERSVNEYILDQLGEQRTPPEPATLPPGVRISAPLARLAPRVTAHQQAHMTELRELAEQYIDAMQTRWPEHARAKTLQAMVRQTLYGVSTKTPYSLSRLITTLSRMRNRERGFEHLCARCGMHVPNDRAPNY